MNKIIAYFFSSASAGTVAWVLPVMRIGIGILTIGHGIPKMLGGPEMWQNLGGFMGSVGIHWLPMVWGLLGACTEFFGGIALVFGLATRAACVPLIFMMVVATMWHLDRGDSFNLYSFPLSLIIVFCCFLILGSGGVSLDSYISRS